MRDPVIMPRSVVEQALSALFATDAEEGTEAYDRELEAITAILEVLKKPTQAGPVSVPNGWKLVPVEPTDDMLYDIQEYSHILPPRGKRIWAHLLNAAPQPPVVLEPQVNQDPVAFIRNRIADDFSVRLNRVVTAEDFAGDQAQFLAWCSAHADSDWKPLYSHTQPKREPLTEEQIADIEDMFSNEFGLEAKHSIDFARAIERAHGIGGEA